MTMTATQPSQARQWKTTDLADLLLDHADDATETGWGYDERGDFGMLLELPANLTHTVRLAPGEAAPQEVLLGDLKRVEIYSPYWSQHTGRIYDLMGELTGTAVDPDTGCTLATYSIHKA